MAEPTVAFIKKSKNRPTNTRKRAAEDTVPTAAASEVYRAPKRALAGPLVASSASYRPKRTRTDVSDNEDEDVGIRFSSKKSVNPGKERSASPEIRTAEDAALLTERENKDDGLYRGAKSYTSQLPKASAKYTATAGPSNVRTITITDFQPDVCKDYKETGFCTSQCHLLGSS